MLINNFLENSDLHHPEKQAVWYKDQWFTYNQINETANRVANYLISIGIKRGDRVAILYENSFEYIVSYFGILKAGGVTVALNTETTSQTLVYIINHSNAKAIISQGNYLKYLLPAIKKTPELEYIIIEHSKPENCIGPDCKQEAECLERVLENGNASEPGVKCIDIDLASIVYTSGSTGQPKGVMLTHQNIVSNTMSIVKYLKLTQDDRIMVVLPFYYIYGQSLLTTHFCVSGSVVIENRLVYPQISLETMHDTEATGFAGVPSTFLILLDRTTVREIEFPKLRYITQAGGAMAPSTQKQVAEVFSYAELFIMYGATEAGPRLTYVPPERLPEKWGSIGKAVDNVEVFIADEYGNRLMPGIEGEVVARGSNIMAGYWRDPKGTAEVLKNGLYYTGDLGVMDEEGYFFIVGRKKEIIKAGGFRVSSKEIEEAILSNNDIYEVAVIGVVDEIFGEAIKAFVVPKEGITLYADSLKKHLKKMLPAFKHPKYFEIIESLPRNQSGKIIKTKLN